MAHARKTSAAIKYTEKYSDFTIGFGLNPFDGDIAKITDIDAVKRSIVSLVLTDKYERLLDPRIGSSVKKMLFEPMSGLTSMMLKNYIEECITNYEPRAAVEQVIVQPDYDRNSYYVTINFSIRSEEEVQVVQFLLERIR